MDTPYFENKDQLEALDASMGLANTPKQKRRQNKTSIHSLMNSAG